MAEETIVSTVSHTSLVEAGRIAYKDLLNWLDGVTEMSRAQLGRLPQSVADLGICQVSNGLYTAHCEIPRRYVDLLDPTQHWAYPDGRPGTGHRYDLGYAGANGSRLAPGGSTRDDLDARARPRRSHLLLE